MRRFWRDSKQNTPRTVTTKNSTHKSAHVVISFDKSVHLLVWGTGRYAKFILRTNFRNYPFWWSVVYSLTSFRYFRYDVFWFVFEVIGVPVHFLWDIKDSLLGTSKHIFLKQITIMISGNIIGNKISHGTVNFTRQGFKR